MLGTHNSMTYAKPYHWYGWLMIPFARCQRKTLREQIQAGARCFDLRVRFDKHGEPYFAHGAMRVKGEVSSVLLELSFHATVKLKEKILVRLILEDPRLRKEQEILFQNFCHDVEKEYHTLTFFEGRRKGDWALLYNFKHKQPINQFVSSMADDARWYERVLPFAYAKRRNKANLKYANEVLKDSVNLFDFI